jgi:hypothetical protein
MTFLTDPRVPAIIKRIRSNPPPHRIVKVPSRSCLYGRDDYVEYYGEDVDALRAIDNELFLAAEDAHGMEGARDYLASRVDAQDVVRRILAGKL